MKTPAIEPLESRIAPATLLALNDSDQLLRFNSATPGTIAATVAIASLGGTEDVIGIDFRPATGQLYGLGLDGTTARLLTIDPVTGATAQIGATFTVSGTSFGFDFNPAADRLRVVSDADINLSINPADGVVTTQTALNPGTPNVVGAAYTNSFPGATTTTLYAIDSGTDVLATITPPASGTLATVGALGADTSDVVGFDIGHGKSEAFAALRVGGSSQLHTINLTTGAATLVGTIDTGAANIRGLAVVLHTWDGDFGSSALSAPGNWVSGIAPAPGDALLFPAGAASFSVNQNFALDTTFNSLRFTGGGYDIFGFRMKLEGGITSHAPGVNRVGLVDLRGASAGVDFITVENAASELSFTILTVDADLGDGLEFSGAGIIRTSTLTAFGSAVPIVVNGPELISGATYTAPGGTTLEAGIITVNGGFSAVTVEGGTLRGRGFTGAVTGTGGTIFSSAESLDVNGNLTLNTGTTASFNLPLDTALDPLRVNGAVSLGDAQLTVTLNGNLPARLTLLLNDGADAITGTFDTFAEGATVMASGQAYAISYVGGDGNDVVLTKTSGPSPTINGNTATYVDVDGDDVTVKSSSGPLTPGNFVMRDTGGGRMQLEMIDLVGDPTFNGASITLTAKRGATGGDGSANVGFIDALGIELGKVSIAGDLGAIDVGNGTDNIGALKSLAVQSLGAFGLGTGAPDLQSNIDGRLDNLTVRGDVRGARIIVFDSVVTPGGNDLDASIGTVTIGGSLVGGASPFSGRIDAQQNIGTVTIKGDLRGGMGDNSGIVEAGRSLSTFALTGSLAGGHGVGSGAVFSDGPAKSFKIGRDVVGGMGDDSATIGADEGLGSLTIGGSLFGGAGDDSGRIDVDDEPLGALTIGGSVVGGTGIASAQIFVDRGKSITIKGSLIGNAEDSAFIDIDENIDSLTIGGSVLGGAGENSANINSGSEPIGSLKIGGAMIGGAGEDSAVIDTSGDITSLSIGGSFQGGGGEDSASIIANNIGKLTIGGSFAGGAGTASGVIDTDAVGTFKIGGDFMGGSGPDSGRIDAASITSLNITRSIFTGTGAGSGLFAIDGDLGELKVGGGIVGTAANRFLVLVGAQSTPTNGADVVLGKLSVKGSVQHALILAGFDTVPSGRNADAQIGSVMVGGDWIASSISAGVQDDADNTLNSTFGDADDQIIAGIGTTNDGTLKSKIGSITIKGQLLGTAAGGDSFGFVAEEIGSVKVGAFAEPLTAAVDAQPLGATGDFVAREDVVGLNVPLPVFAGAAGVNVVSTTLATFVDVDGDLVTIKSSLPILDITDFTSIVSGSGNQLQLIDFTNDGPQGSGVNLTITAAPQDVNADGKKDGDGFVNIGRIAAAGLDLGAISITGDLGQLDAGDLTTLNSPAVKSLTVQSMGEFGTMTQGGGDLVSSITGAVGSLTVKGNIRDAQVNLTAATVAHATISKVTLGGSLIGGAADDSGNIFATGDIGSVTIGGSILGGTGDHSALLRANGTMGKATIAGSILGGGTAVVGNRDAGRLSSGGDMGEVKITGDVRGGPGELSGTIFAGGKLKSLTIGGSLVGGDGDHDTVVGQEGQIHSGGDMGNVTITREIVGGAGDRSAQILSVAKIASVKVGGVVKGGAGEDSGAIRAGATLDTVEIKGDLLGGDGSSSGRVEAVGAVKSFTLTGSLIGGGAGSSGHVVGGSFEKAKIGGSILGAADFGTGFFESNGALKSISVGGSILGGTGIDTGQIEAVGDIGSAKIAGDIRGGDATGVLVLFCSGFVASDGRIGSITVGGSLVSGTDTSTGTCTNNGAIAAGNDIGSLTVKGSLIGNSTRTVVISARGQALPTATTDVAIGKIDIGGRVEFAQILAGYDNNGTTAVESNADAQIGSVKVTGDWIASSLVAGVKNRGADNTDDLGFDDDNIDFGNARDQKIAEAADALTSKIASITIKGQALGTVGGTDHFGFVSQEIGALKIGAVKYALVAGPASAADITGYPVGATGDLRVQEVV